MTPEQQAALAAVRQRLAAQQGGQQPPPGASPAQVPQQAPEDSEPFQRVGGRGAFMAGVGDSAIKGYMGLKQLIPGVGLNEDNKRVLKMIEEEYAADPEGFKRGSGGLAGTIAALALPGNAVARGVQGLRVLTGAGRMLPYLAGSASAGATEFATAVGQGETQGEQLTSKAKQAAVAAVASPILQKTLGAAGRFIARPFRPSAEAKYLMDKGIITPTLQEGAEGGWGKFIGGLASGAVPVRNRQAQEAEQYLVRRITEGNRDALQGRALDSVRTADDYVDDAYRTLFDKKRFRLSPRERADLAQQVAQGNKSEQFQQARGIASRELNEVMGVAPLDTLGREATTHFRDVGSLRESLLNPLAKKASQLTDKGEDEAGRRLRGAFDSLKDTVLKRPLSADEVKRLGEVDNLNFDLSRLKEATGSSAGEAESIPFKRLFDAYARNRSQAEKIGNTTEEDVLGHIQRLLGQGLTQDQPRSLKIAATRALAPGALAVGASTAASTPLGATAAAIMGPMYAASLAGQTAKGARALMGQTGAQKKLFEAIDAADLYRAAGRSGTAAAMRQQLSRGKPAGETLTDATIEALRRINKVRAVERGVVSDYSKDEGYAP